MFYLDIKNRWLSAIMQPQSRMTRYFLLDIDTKDKKEVEEIENNLKAMKVNKFFRYETKNGYYIISEPFNPQILPFIQIKKDGLLLLNY